MITSVEGSAIVKIKHDKKIKDELQKQAEKVYVEVTFMPKLEAITDEAM